ncbi:MAG: metal ABC transporter solute-binding protein, Zn/Mn family [Aeoliella sp.]
MATSFNWAKRSRNSLLCLIALGLAASMGCNSSSDHSHPLTASIDHKFSGELPLKILCTTGQIAEAVEQIAGEHAEVTALMGPGVDPHLYRAVPADVALLQSADIVFYNGLHLEGRIVETLEQLGKKKPVVAVAARLEEQKDDRLRTPPEFEGLHDPHVWHDALLWADCTDYAAERLAAFDSDRATDYSANSKAYRDKLEALDQWCRDEIATIPEERRVLVTAHDAFGYFSNEYGLKAVGLKGISTEDEVDFQHMDEVIKLLVEHKIPAVFVESSTAPRIVEALIEPCQKQGHDVSIGGELYADALGSADSGADTYEGMIRANVQTIVAGLNGE